MTPSQLPVALRTQQTVAAYYRAGYPIAEIADAVGLSRAACRELLAAMRGAGWTLRRPRGAHERIQVDNALLRERYLRRRAEARRGDERLSLSELARAAGLTRPGQQPDTTWIGRLLRLTPNPDGSPRTQIPLGPALALGRALGLDPHEIEACEIRPQPARFHAPRQGLPTLAAADEPPIEAHADLTAAAA